MKASFVGRVAIVTGGGSGLTKTLAFCHLLWNDLLAHGLLDELHLMVGAGVLVEGVRAFETRPLGSLRLLDSRTFDGSSLLLAWYAVEG